MQFITPSATLIQESDPFRKIELAARTCYKSEAKITEDSGKKLVKNLIEHNHTAMLEHQVFVFEVVDGEHTANFINAICANPFTHTTLWDDRVLVSANVRALNEDASASPLLREVAKKYPEFVYGQSYHPEIFPSLKVRIVDMDNPNEKFSDVEYHYHYPITLRLITDRGVTHELVRHRQASYAQESTRYCRYNNGLSIALPTGFFCKAPEVQEVYENAFRAAELYYGKLLDMGELPQQARAVLPTGVKTEIVVTANLNEWKHILNLRMMGTTGAPHPDIKTLMIAACKEMGKLPPVTSRKIRLPEIVE